MNHAFLRPSRQSWKSMPESTSKLIQLRCIGEIDAELIFSNAAFFTNQIRRYIAEVATPLRQVLVDAEAVNDIDSTGTDHLESLHVQLARQEIRLVYAEVKDPVREKMSRAGLEEIIGADSFHETVDEGVLAFLEERLDLD